MSIPAKQDLLKNKLTPRELKSIFHRNHGAGAKLARDLGIANQNIYDWLNGTIRRSKRVEAAIRQRAVELLRAEKKRAATEAAALAALASESPAEQAADADAPEQTNVVPAA